MRFVDTLKYFKHRGNIYAFAVLASDRTSESGATLHNAPLDCLLHIVSQRPPQLKANLSTLSSLALILLLHNLLTTLIVASADRCNCPNLSALQCCSRSAFPLNICIRLLQGPMYLAIEDIRVMHHGIHLFIYIYYRYRVLKNFNVEILILQYFQIIYCSIILYNNNHILCNSALGAIDRRRCRN